jgi:hypothetical protein
VRLLAAEGLAAQAREIDVNGLYPAGTRLSSPKTGIGFQLPAGFRAEWDSGLGALLALSADGAFGAVWGWSEGTVEEVAGEVGTRLEQQGIALEVRGEPELTQTVMRAVFDAVTADGRGVLHASIRQGPRGGVVAVAGLGAAATEATAARFVEQVLGSLEWGEPGVAVWRQRVEGAVLTRSGGPTAATVALSSPATLSFCSPTEYVYRETSSDGHQGGWWLIADLSGRPLLILADADRGRTFQWSVEESAEGFSIDGSLFRVTGRC